VGRERKDNSKCCKSIKHGSYYVSVNWRLYKLTPHQPLACTATFSQWILLSVSSYFCLLLYFFNYVTHHRHSRQNLSLFIHHSLFCASSYVSYFLYNFLLNAELHCLHWQFHEGWGFCVGSLFNHTTRSCRQVITYIRIKTILDPTIFYHTVSHQSTENLRVIPFNVDVVIDAQIQCHKSKLVK